MLASIMQTQAIPQRLPDRALALERAAAMLGGRAELAERLNVSQRQLDYWIREIGTPPDTVFFDVLDIIIENAGAWRA
ncbi:MAG: hypothetical protein A3G81_22660 [Betaproteobacteria bacterium RIFCSPLOWO2_12_FULL_65_14]|nr:MAG: hypothetical protein A3G81_22660 [Betaproteobacteria bacterium RIFCSPLOWO2_12_FULL_65_14]